MPMLLKGEDEREFELALIADPLAESQDGHGDAAAVTISFRVATPEDEWEETAPCMNLFEVQNLVDWLGAVAAGEGESAELELLEPELRFVVVKDHGKKLTLRIEFHLADRPEEFTVDSDTDMDHIDIRLTRERIALAAEELRHDLEMVAAAGRDDLEGEEDLGQVRSPDEDLAMIDREEPPPPMGSGEGPDNAGNR